MEDPVAASKLLVDHALSRFSTDNLSCMIVRIDGGRRAQAQARGGGGGEGEKEKEGEGFRPTALDSTVEEEGEGAEKEAGSAAEGAGEAK